MQVSAIGLPWYKPENFAILRTMFVDGKIFEDSYTDWLSAAQKQRARLIAQGKQVVVADIDPIAFPMWCRSQGLRLDSTARRRYAEMVAQQALGGDRGSDLLQ
jgi:hypothetical protein